MKTGTIVSTILAAGAGIGLMTVFVTNASPYMTVKEADGTTQKVHVVGKIVPKTLKQNTLAQQVTFELEDESGMMPVLYSGPPMSNLSTATQVVVIGSKKEGVFETHQMLVKCPSKYEAEKKST